MVIIFVNMLSKFGHVMTCGLHSAFSDADSLTQELSKSLTFVEEPQENTCLTEMKAKGSQ